MGQGRAETTKCRACGKEIRFIKTALYKATPVDAEPVYIEPDQGAEGIYVLPTGGTIRGRIIPDEEIEQDTELRMAYVSHFATCTEPGRFRKPRKPRDRDKKAGDNRG